jgi:hypothetical protein
MLFAKVVSKIRRLPALNTAPPRPAPEAENFPPLPPVVKLVVKNALWITPVEPEDKNTAPPIPSPEGKLWMKVDPGGVPPPIALLFVKVEAPMITVELLA